MKQFYLSLILLTFSSCATMFNASTENLNIYTSKPSKIIIGKDTSSTYVTHKYATVPRSKESLEITATGTDFSKEIFLKSRTSFAYWLNIYPSCGLGMLVDRKAPNRYAYPKNVFVDISKEGNSYLKYKPLDSTTAKLKNIVKITPFRLFALSNASFEISLERKTGPLLSSQIMLSYLLPQSSLDYNNGFNPNTKGYRISIEEKMYLKKSSPQGPYFGFEINQMRSQYRDIALFGKPDINSEFVYLNEYADSIKIQKHTTSLNFKFGYQEIIGRFSFDFFCGLGARYRKVSHQNRINPTDEMVSPRHPNFYYTNNVESNSWITVLVLNWRIGWMF